MDLLEHAVTELAIRCDGAATEDGVGFNKADSYFGKALAAKNANTWSPKQRRAIWRMIAKYRGQLQNYGIEYRDIDEPDIPEEIEARREMFRHDGAIRLSFEYHPDLVSGVKEIPKHLRQYDPKTKIWEVQPSFEIIQHLINYAVRYDFDVHDGVHALFAAMIEQHEILSEGSRSSESTLEITGLGGTLYSFQLAGVEYAVQAERLFIADQMGTGKTIEALATIHVKKAYPALVVCPSSVKYNWAKEILKWLPGKSVGMVKGRKFYAVRIANDSGRMYLESDEHNLPGAYDVIVMNYDILKPRPNIWRCHEAFTNAKGKAYAVGDEITEPINGYKRDTRELVSQHFKRHGYGPSKNGLIEKMLKIGLQAVVLDECLLYDTMIFTDHGPVPIGDIVESQMSVRVLSCDLSRNVLRYKPVTRWIKNTLLSGLVRITYEHGSIICTPHHKIWIEEVGYVLATKIKSGTYLRMVRSEVQYCEKRENNSSFLQQKLRGKAHEFNTGNQRSHISGLEKTNANSNLRMVSAHSHGKISKKQKRTPKILRTLLRSHMEDDTSRAQRTVSPDNKNYARSKSWEQETRSIRPDEDKQSNVDAWRERKDDSNNEGANLSGKRWQTNDHRNAKDSSRSPWSRVLFRISNRNWSGKETIGILWRSIVGKFAKVLFSRYSSPSVKNSHRSGRGNTQTPAMAQERQKKRNGIEQTRVVSVEVLERADIERLGFGDHGDQFVYNLEVEDDHNYVAENILVSNSHYTKSYKSQRSKGCQQVVKDVPIRLLLSGTPLLNRPSELIPQLQILDRLNDMGGFWGFASRYTGAYQGKWGMDLSGATNLEELNAKLRSLCYLRRLKSDVMTELPDKQRSNVMLELSNRETYDEAERDLVKWLRDNARVKDEFMESIMHLSEEEQARAIADYRMSAAARAERALQLTKIEHLKQITARGKMEMAEEWITDFLESEEKLVVFAGHIEIQKQIIEMFSSRKPAHILGEDSSEERQANIERFQTDDDCRLIVCSLKSGGIGITLTAASNVAFLELGWTPADHDQAEDRLHRIGQENNVMAWYLLAENTIDDDLQELINEKRAVVDATTEGEALPEGSTSILNDLLERLKKQ